VVSGPVTLRFRGRMAEKLLDRARAEGIQIDSAERVNERETILRTGEADARRILELAERYKLDVKILRVGGFPRIKQTLRQRLAMALSLAILLSALAILSGRAWLVEVKLTGAQPENLSRAMRASGVHVGMNLTGLDAYALSQRLLSEAGDLAYVGVRVTGVRLSMTWTPRGISAPFRTAWWRRSRSCTASRRSSRATRSGAARR
jgi:hypothetical protein